MSNTKRPNLTDRKSSRVRDYSIVGDALDKILLERFEKRQREAYQKLPAANPATVQPAQPA